MEGDIVVPVGDEGAGAGAEELLVISPAKLRGKGQVLKKRWARHVDEKIIKDLKKRFPPYKISADDFVDMVFGLQTGILELLAELPEEEMYKRIYKYYKQLNDKRPPQPLLMRIGLDRRVRPETYPSPITGSCSGGRGDQPKGTMAKERELTSMKLRSKLKLNTFALVDSLDPPNDSQPEDVPDTPEPVKVKLTKRDRLGAVWSWIKTGGNGPPIRSSRVAPAPM